MFPRHSKITTKCLDTFVAHCVRGKNFTSTAGPESWTICSIVWPLMKPVKGVHVKFYQEADDFENTG